MEYVTRMGDGRTVMMTKEQIYEDAVAGMADAVDAAGVPDLTQDDLDQICEIICNTNRVVAVERGKRDACDIRNAERSDKFLEIGNDFVEIVRLFGERRQRLVYQSNEDWINDNNASTESLIEIYKSLKKEV